MGLTAPDGGRIQSLPYTEGQLLVTLIDDWRRIRAEPQILCWGARATVTAGAATFATCGFEANTRVARLLYVDSSEAILASRVNGFGAMAPSGAPVTLLEGPPLAGAPGGRLVTFPPQAVSFLDPLGFVGARDINNPIGQWLPRLIFPGEHFVFSRSVVNSPFTLDLAWEELPSLTDILTSVAPSIDQP